MKKLISIVLVFIMVISLAVISANAALPPVMIGDVDKNFSVNVIDVSYIQQLLADFDLDYKVEYYIDYLGDVNFDGKITIEDATYMQKWLADIIEDDRIEMVVHADLSFNDFYVDYESGAAQVGVPVTFTCVASADDKLVIDYKLFVDGEMVATNTTGVIEYVFENAGQYDLEIVADNGLRESSFRIYEYVVIEEATEQLCFKNYYITGRYLGDIIFDLDKMTIHTEAMGGVAPYDYEFDFYLCDEEGNPLLETILYQTYSEKNTFELPRLDSIDYKYGNRAPGCIEITVRDAKGDKITRTEKFVYEHMRIG